MNSTTPRIMIAAAASGSGKTTVTCALLAALKNKNKKVSAFKCGPDYIDPMFHTRVLGVHSTNLDLFLTGEDTCVNLLGKHSDDCDLAVMEGVMGYYDGLSAGTKYSSYHLASCTKTPVVLVLSCKGLACTIAAIVKGLSEFKSDSNIKGVILNNTSEKMFLFYKEILERETDVTVLGYMPSMPDCGFESRHLGLITAQETKDLEAKIQKLADTASRTVDFDRLFALADTAPPLAYRKMQTEKQFDVTIGVAHDRAFCFYYQDALELLAESGAKITYFSPLNDREMPDCDGFILGGGYPELYLDRLAENKTMLLSVRDQIQKGTPYIAECGGFMYLFDTVQDKEDNAYHMVGVMEGEVFMTKRLNRFGYITLTAHHDNLLCKKGETIHAHEFHYSDSTNNGCDFTASKPGFGINWECMFADEQRFAGYPHIHLLYNVTYAERFLSKCRERNLKR